VNSVIAAPSGASPSEWASDVVSLVLETTCLSLVDHIDRAAG
jgi:hypothetical protein